MRRLAATLLLAAGVLAAQGRGPRACREVMPRLEAAHKLDGNNIDALAGLLECQIELKQGAEAEQSFQQLDRLLGGRDPRLLELGAMLANRGSYRLAIRAFQKALHANPESYDAAYNLGLAFFLSDDTASAAGVLARVLERHETAEGQDLLGRVYEKREPSQALRHYQRAVELDPANEDFRFDYCLLVIQQDRRYYGADQLAAAVRDFPNSPRMWAALGATNFLKGDDQRCFQALLHARQLAPDFEQTYFYLGRLYSKAAPDTQKKILAILKERISGHPDDAWTHYFYGAALADEQVDRETPDYAEAEAHLRSAIRLERKLAEAHLNLGLIYNSQGKLAESVLEFERAVQSDPALAEAHYRLGLAYQKLGRPQAATREFEAHERLRGEPTDESGKRRARIAPPVR